MFGGVRFGGTLTIDSAFELGFDHIALCAGAGRPTVIPMKNGLVRGVRQASDFLMALQLTGAAKSDSLANLQIRMPIVVIGGGLTAIDTATESLAYYVVQVEKFLTRYETLAGGARRDGGARRGRPKKRRSRRNFCARAGHPRGADRRRAGRPADPNLIELLNAWGGVTIAYRRRLIDAPSYTLNHEEVAKAFEEGVRFAECLSPEEVEVDAVRRTPQRCGSEYVSTKTGKLVAPASGHLPADRSWWRRARSRTRCWRARIEHNVMLDGRYFQAVDEDGNPVKPERIAKPPMPTC